MGLPLPLATCLSWVGPPTNLGGPGEHSLISEIKTKNQDPKLTGFSFTPLSERQPRMGRRRRAFLY